MDNADRLRELLESCDPPVPIMWLGATVADGPSLTILLDGDTTTNELEQLSMPEPGNG